MSRKPRLLHLHSGFDPGGKELRCVQLMNAFGPRAEHTVVSAMPGAYGAAAKVARGIPLILAPDFPALQGRPTPGRLQRIARAMADYDLILTYNFGAMDACMAHTLFGQMLGLAPLIHHEDGFNQDETLRRSAKRNWYRRIALGRASLVVCSHGLEAIARKEWHVAETRLHRIANGIATAAYAAHPRADALPRVIKRPGELWLGTLAGLRAVKNLPRLVRAFAPLSDEWQLVIVGEGPERQAILDEAMRLDIGHRVHLPGHVAEPSRVVGLFDMFALSSDSEQAPISVIEAMAAGLPVAAPDVGDVRAMLSEPNRRFVSPPGDEVALGAALAALAAEAPLRAEIGKANRARARADFDEKAMITAYRQLYSGAMGRAI